VLWTLGKGLRHVVVRRRRRRGPRRPSWDATYETLATVLHFYARRSTRLPIAWQRRAAEGFFSTTPIVKETLIEQVTARGVPAAWYRRDDTSDDTVLYYLHGGGYSIGSLTSHGDFIIRLARATGVTGFAVDYRLAPEHPFPAQLHDALEGYQYLLEQGFEPSQIVIGGESAGGGLTLSTLVALRDRDLPLPAAAVVISPWLDLEGLGPSMQSNEPYDYLNQKVLRAFAANFVTPDQLREPLAAPLYADLTGLPPILIHAGGAEVLVDDSRRLAERLQDAGTPHQLVVFDDMIHAWHIFAPLLKEGQHAIDQAGAFLRRHLPTLTTVNEE